MHCVPQQTRSHPIQHTWDVKQLDAQALLPCIETWRAIGCARGEGEMHTVGVSCGVRAEANDVLPSLGGEAGLLLQFPAGRML